MPLATLVASSAANAFLDESIAPDQSSIKPLAMQQSCEVGQPLTQSYVHSSYSNAWSGSKAPPDAEQVKARHLSREAPAQKTSNGGTNEEGTLQVVRHQEDLLANEDLEIAARKGHEQQHRIRLHSNFTAIDRRNTQQRGVDLTVSDMGLEREETQYGLEYLQVSGLESDEGTKLRLEAQMEVPRLGGPAPRNKRQANSILNKHRIEDAHTLQMQTHWRDNQSVQNPIRAAPREPGGLAHSFCATCASRGNHLVADASHQGPVPLQRNHTHREFHGSRKAHEGGWPDNQSQPVPLRYATSSYSSNNLNTSMRDCEPRHEASKSAISKAEFAPVGLRLGQSMNLSRVSESSRSRKDKEADDSSGRMASRFARRKGVRDQPRGLKERSPGIRKISPNSEREQS